MKKVLVSSLLAVLALPALAEVVIEKTQEPLLEKYRAEIAARGESADGPSLVPKGNRPLNRIWFIPLFKVDTRSPSATSTFWSIRNEGGPGENTAFVADYRTVRFESQVSVGGALIPKQVGSFNVRDVAGLAIDRDRFARGVIRITPEVDRPIVVDAFQVDPGNNFATGALAYAFPDDFCTNWMVRFLGFGGLAGGSTMTILVNGPRGSGAGNPPTVVGTVYSQTGAPINTFMIRTDQWVLEVPVLDFVSGDTKFGSVELVLNSTATPRGVVNVSHSAFSKFSVGVEGVCQDDL